MVNITKYFETTKHAIDGGEVELEFRPYLGMSQIGEECARALWYSFRWMYRDTTSPRMVRLWNRGHREEPELIKELERIGMTCSGDQAEMLAAWGHMKGHRDGVGIGVIEAPKTPHLLEFKTLSDKNFKKLQKVKLAKYSSKYWAQVHCYMKFGKLTRCLFIAVNKNDDDLYIERIHYDKNVAEDMIRKGEFIVQSDVPPARAYSTKTFFACKWCPANSICWEGAEPQKNCRTCKYGNPLTGENAGMQGTWVCTLPDEFVTIPLEIQRTGCKNYVRKEST